MKFLKNSRGFTIIELLAVIVVLVSIGSIVVIILTDTFKGNLKSNVTNKIRENGDFTILKMSREIQFARAFVGVSTDGVSSYVRDVCVLPPAPTPTPDPTHYASIQLLDSNRDAIIYTCDSATNSLKRTSSTGTTTLLPPSDNSPTPGGINIVLTSGSCYFTCSQTYVTDQPQVGINFTLQNTGDQTTIPFETSVSIRNLNK